MGKRGYQPEQIIYKLREVEVLLSTGNSVQAADLRTSWLKTTVRTRGGETEEWLYLDQEKVDNVMSKKKGPP